MKKQIEQVKEFNKVFGVKYNKEFNELFAVEYNSKPTLISKTEWGLRDKLMIEELDEYYDACEQGDLVEVADALGDMLYILCGTILAHGMQYKIKEVFNEIHKSNLSKLEDGKVLRRADGKVLKGKDYFKPNIKAILDENIRD